MSVFSTLDNNLLTLRNNLVDEIIAFSFDLNEFSFISPSLNRITINNLESIDVESITDETLTNKSVFALFTNPTINIGNTQSTVNIVTNVNITNTNSNLPDVEVQNEPVVGRDILYLAFIGQLILVNGVFQTINFDTTVFNDGPYSISTGDITIQDIGIYEVSYSILVNKIATTGQTRSTLESQCLLDSSVLDQSTAILYLRIGQGSQPDLASSITKIFALETTSSNSILNVQVRRDGSSNFSVDNNTGTTIYIKKIS